jgi:hypothetical protein
MRVEDSQNQTHSGWAPPEFHQRPTTDTPDIAEVPGDEQPPDGGHYDSGTGETPTERSAEPEADRGESPPDDFSPDQPTSVDEPTSPDEPTSTAESTGPDERTSVDQPAGSAESTGAPEPAVGVASVPTGAPSDAPTAPVEPAQEETAQEESAQEEEVPVEAAQEEPARKEPAREPAEELAPGDVPDRVVAAFWELEVVDGYRDRWQQIQLQFIDDPRYAAERSQELVNDVVQELVSALTRRREDLHRWRAAQLDDTEELRVAVRRYRDLLDKLLAL